MCNSDEHIHSICAITAVSSVKIRRPNNENVPNGKWRSPRLMQPLWEVLSSECQHNTESLCLDEKQQEKLYTNLV